MGVEYGGFLVECLLLSHHHFFSGMFMFAVNSRIPNAIRPISQKDLVSINIGTELTERWSSRHMKDSILMSLSCLQMSLSYKASGSAPVLFFFLSQPLFLSTDK
jgi:hypothetical protein